jgi:hypothetical protein
MRRQRFWLSTLFAVTLLVPLATSRVAAAASTVDSIALASSPDGSTPISVGGGVKHWVYPSFCSTGSFVQTFPVDLQFSGGTGSQSTTVHFIARGGLKNFTTLPSDVTLNDDGSVQGPFNISVNASGLVAGTYGLNIRLSASNGFSLKHRFIQIVLIVGASCTGVGSSIVFWSDDQLNDFVDCTGADPGPIPTGGTFQINPAPPMDTLVGSTTPSSMYYHFIYSNPGASITPDLDFLPTGITPNGTDAVHVKVYSTATFTADLPTFADVNTTGTSCGASGPCSAVAVNTGQTLWATWTIGWSGVGGSSAGISLSCPGDQTMTEMTTLVNGTSTLALSNGSATGYLVCLGGDVNGDGLVNVADVFYLINYLFAGGPAPICPTSGNVSGDTTTDVSDVFYLINYLFAGGPPPA